MQFLHVIEPTVVSDTMYTHSTIATNRQFVRHSGVFITPQHPTVEQIFSPSTQYFNSVWTNRPSNLHYKLFLLLSSY